MPIPKSSTHPITDDEAPVTTKTYLQAISDGLREEMRRDQRVFLLGEDIGVYGGAFKVTQGFLQEFGEDRVIDAPLSETAITGACTGAALMGMRPVCEMQFSDFVSCAFDQLVTVAAKQHYRVGTPVPIVVRLPSGGGFSGGPFHSQNPEGFFAHCPGLKIACPATPADAKGLIDPGHPRPQPGAVLRAQAPLPADQGRGARGRAHGRVRQGPHPPRGRRHHHRHLRRDGVHGRGGRRGGRRGRRHVGRDHRSAHDHPVGQGGGAGVGVEDQHALKLATNGNTIQEIESSAKDFCEHLEHIFTVDDLTYLARGGRISKASAFVGGLLNIKPLLHVDDGKLVPLEKIRGKKKLLRRMIELMKERSVDLTTDETTTSATEMTKRRPKKSNG